MDNPSPNAPLLPFLWDCCEHGPVHPGFLSPPVCALPSDLAAAGMQTPLQQKGRAAPGKQEQK